jgi:chromate transport protein ChrA
MERESAIARWMAPGSRSRRVILGLALYVVTTGVFATVAGPDRLRQHTQFNHYALLADAWLHGRQDLPGGPPAYTGNNDFAQYVDPDTGARKTFISFPPFPAVLMLPFVKLSGSAEEFRDGQFIVWLSGIAPAVLFLVLEKLRRTGRSARSEPANLGLAALFAFGTVYFFTAVQGTVWFAAHVVAADLLALYVLFALDAERPLLASALLACAWLTRPPVLLAFPLLALEALRVSCKDGLPAEGNLVERLRETYRRLDLVALLKRAALVSIPVLCALAVMSWMNYTRFHTANPTSFGHEHLTVAWHARIAKWGLFSFHYLGKNLGVAFTLLPWTRPFQINEHGLALWFTTPLFVWILWPRTKSWLYGATALSAALPALLDLFYQNSGWVQFGYRFSNDYSLLLFVLLAIGGRPMGWLFRAAAAWSVAWNLFGAVSFERAGYQQYYFREGSQTVLYQPD